MTPQTATRGQRAARLADEVVSSADNAQRTALLAELARMCDAAGVDPAVLLTDARRRAAARATPATDK